ncbi:MocR-like transcription factor YczR [Nocardioides donggukensis]|uniref:PLP-dependent aminotransferase family protein n=1 Tax=Nocardioides donggukensis TaxID=2774019 RepID=A0A927K3A1_9ACTN|nr:PLP-dependent aminotransferase family protein [Nocardioides donggukensis]MBD8868971.1 PLP-dependent aminotransferase family protein [Nocardioides donggukensis]
MSTLVTAGRVATLVGDFPRSPAYVGLADALRMLVTDGRIPHGTRLPSERDLTAALAVSRTTVTRAYAELRERGYAEARQGAGTFTRLPGGPDRATDRTLTPRAGGRDLIDLTCAAASAPPGLAAAYEAALTDLPAYLSGHGYFPAGLPELQRAIAARYDARGLPTDPDQVMVTPGALAGTAVVARACTDPGDRVLVETPGYPNAVHALTQRSTRIVGTAVDPDGWDLDAVAAAIRQASPTAAYLVPDFQNPTGNLMSDADRARYARELARSRTLAIVDEAHQSLALDGQPMPRPMAAHVEEAGGEAVTVGSASKMMWGGLRLGWIRVPHGRRDAVTRARLMLDLGAPVLEQLTLTRLLADPEPVVAAHRDRLREQRDRLAAAVRAELPDWEFRLPGGGLALWCRLPVPLSSRVVAEAEALGVALAPGPVFARAGGHEHFVRLPWTRPADELEEAVRRLGRAWAVARSGREGRGGEPDRVMVA